MTFYLTNQSFRSKRSLISGVYFTTETILNSQKVKTQKAKVAAESKSGCSHSHSEIHEAFTIKKLDWILQFWPPSSSPPFKNKTVMEEEDYSWRTKLYFFRGEHNQERKIRSKFGDGKYIFLLGKRLIVKEKEENIWRRKIYLLRRRKIKEKEKEDHLQEAGPSR